MKILNKYLTIIACLFAMLVMSSCGEKDNVYVGTAPATPIEVQNDIQQPEITIEVIPDKDSKESGDEGENGDEGDDGIDGEDENEDEEGDGAEDEDDETSEEGSLNFDPDDSFSYCEKPICKYVKDSNKISFEIKFKNGIPKSDDKKIYLFEVATYESESALNGKEPVSSAGKKDKMTLTAEYKDRYLFARFVPAVLSEGSYVPISNGQYITNPSEISNNSKAYMSTKSKKGFLVDSTTIGTDKLDSLNVSRVIYNIPLSYIIGESTSPDCPTINYEYNGKVYHFNGYNCMLFDSLFSRLTNSGYHCTAIILNDWNSKHPEMIHPKSRQKTGSSLYYAFNTEEENGVRLTEAAALFLAERYTSGEHGMVYDWVIGNEVNQQTNWNYMATSDVDYYTESLERSFRTFYNAIKSKYSKANVYFSIDHDWNDNGGDNSKFFNGKELLSIFNKYARRRGNYNWGVAIHPYPVPLTNVRFWEGEFDKSESASALTPMNLSTLTKVLRQDEYLDANGNVRNIAITELGFSSMADEKVQAAAYAYCYYIVDNNKYIKSFILNRQTDDSSEMASGLALGVYHRDLSPKYLTNVFRNIDSGAGSEYIPEMLSIIGASSLEEALAWAQ